MNERMDEETEERTNPILQGPSGYPPVVQKRKKENLS